MSTDDLTRRARLRALSAPDAATSADLSELADEVDRLRATEGVCTHQNGQYLAMKAERDAARAALERVREVAETAELAAPFGKPPYWTGHILNALEGES